MGEHPSGINQGRGSNADRSCCDTVHTVLRVYGAASTVLNCLLAYPRAVLLVLLERDLLYAIHTTCMLFYRRKSLSNNLYSGIHSTHQRPHRYNWIAYRCLALVGLSTGQCLLYLRISGAVQTVVFAVQTVIAGCPNCHCPPHIFANLRQLILHTWGCHWDVRVLLHPGS